MLDKKLVDALYRLAIQLIYAIDEARHGDKYYTIPNKYNRVLIRKIDSGEIKVASDQVDVTQPS